MNIARAFACVALIAFAVTAQKMPPSRLWLGIGVEKPVYQVGETRLLSVSFMVVNDGAASVDPGIGSSHLFINGVEPEGWPYVINNGPRSSEFTALPPGKILSFGHQLGSKYFAKPGIYTVRWQAGNTRSAELTFRVMPNGSY